MQGYRFALVGGGEKERPKRGHPPVGECIVNVVSDIYMEQSQP